MGNNGRLIVTIFDGYYDLTLARHVDDQIINRNTKVIQMEREQFSKESGKQFSLM